MKMEFNEIPNGFLATLSYAKQKTSLVPESEKYAANMAS